MFSMLESGILYDVKIFAENSIGRGRTPCVTTGFGDQSCKHINNFYACIAACNYTKGCYCPYNYD